MSKTAGKSYIAIVEDDESLCRSLARLLQASGYQPVTYLSAEAFLNDDNHPVFDCLIVDVQLGGMTGIELGEILAADESATPLVFLTAHEEWDALKGTLRIPYNGFLRKSDPAEMVIAAIEKSRVTGALLVHADQE